MGPESLNAAQGGKETSGDGPPVWRRLFHLIAGSTLPIAALIAPELEMTIALAALAAGGLALDAARFRIGWLNRRFMRWFAPILKSNEDRRITGATYMLLSALVVYVAFGATAAAAALLFLSLGDPVAALAGRRMPGPRIGGKSPGGTAAFIGTAWVVTAVLVLTGVTDHYWGLMVGGVVAGLTELVPSPLDDNLTIPIAAGLVMFLIGV